MAEERLEKNIFNLNEFIFFAKELNKLIHPFGFSASDKEVGILFRLNCSSRDAAAIYLNNQVRSKTKVSEFDLGVELIGKTKDILEKCQGFKFFSYQPKAKRIWAVTYINLGIVDNFESALSKTKNLFEFFYKDTKYKFVFDPCLSKRFDRGNLKITECRNMVTGVPGYLIQSQEAFTVVLGMSSLNESIKEAFRRWNKKTLRGF